MPRLDSDQNRQIEVTPEVYDRYKNDLNILKQANLIDIVSTEMMGSPPTDGGGYSLDDEGSILYEGVPATINGPTSSVNNAVAVFDGTTGRLLKTTTAFVDGSGNINNLEGKINGIRSYNKVAIDPTAPTPADGDRYYNTALHMEMRYDGLRGKWLSVESSIIQFGASGDTLVGGYFKGVDGLLSATKGYPAFYAGTVVELAITRSDTDTTTLEVVADGLAIAEMISNSTVTRLQLNADFAAGQILGVRNKATGNTVSDVDGWLKVKWKV
jgi:hypothetical protein